MDSERVQSVQPLRSMRMERVQNVQPLRSVQVVQNVGLGWSRWGHDCATVRSLTAAGSTFRRAAGKILTKASGAAVTVATATDVTALFTA